MAETIETISLIQFQVEGATSVADLKNNISALKKVVNEAEIGTERYKDALALLRQNQNAVKDAAYAEKSGLDAVIQSAKGATTSYNGLVHKMAELKQEFRSTTDEMRRKDLGDEIKSINDQLKKMDALQGNFQRNVGNYEGALSPVVDRLDKMGGILKNFPPTLGAAKEQIGKVGESMQLVGKQPILGIIGLLAPIIMKITSALKENGTAINAVDKAMKALEPVFNLVTSIVEKLAGWIARAVEWFVKLGGEGGETFKKIVSGAVGVGNVLLQFILTPIRNIVEAFKGLGNIIKDVFTGNFKKIKEDATAAFNGIKDSFVKGFSFKDNFDLGKRVGEEFAAGLKSPESKDAVKGAAKEIADEIESALKKVDVTKFDTYGNPALKKRIEEEKKAAEEEAGILEFMRDFEAETLAEINEEWDGYVSNLRDNMNEEMALHQQRIDAIFQVADATSAVFSSLADIYEQDAENNEVAAQQAKNLRIASTIIDTISGAVGAYMRASESLPPPFGQIVGALSATSVAAAGIAQIAKMRSTSVSRNSSSGTTITPMAQAPAFAPSVPQTTVVPSATDEVRLNRMAEDQKVYLVVDELEAKQNDIKVQLAESTF